MNYQSVSFDFLSNHALAILFAHQNVHLQCRLKKLGITVRTKQDAGSSKFKNVLFSAPPSGSSDYVAEVIASRLIFSDLCQTLGL